MQLNVSSAKRRPSCFVLNALIRVPSRLFAHYYAALAPRLCEGHALKCEVNLFVNETFSW